MKSALLSTLVLLLVQSASAQEEGPPIGRWRSLKTSQGGIGAMYEFHPDGAIDFSPGAIVEMYYRIEGDKLVTCDLARSEAEQRSTITWTADGKLHVASGPQAVEYRREGAIQDPGQPILGEWVGTREMAGKHLTIRFLFSASGKALLLMPFTTHHGKYSVRTGRISASFPKDGSLDGSYTVQHGHLTIARSPGRVSEFLQY